MNGRYVHPEPGKATGVVCAGDYTSQQAARLEHEGRELLYLAGCVVVEASGCGGDS